jgi:hypothetical protein
VKPLLELRVLSGPSLGAVIELGPGTYVIGSDGGCDLVLAADASVAGRHLELRVREVGGVPDVWARPPEGGIVINGVETAQEGAALPKKAVLGAGFTALAWQVPGESWGKITLEIGRAHV